MDDRRPARINQNHNSIYLTCLHVDHKPLPPISSLSNDFNLNKTNQLTTKLHELPEFLNVMKGDVQLHKKTCVVISYRCLRTYFMFMFNP